MYLGNIPQRYWKNPWKYLSASSLFGPESFLTVTQLDNRIDSFFLISVCTLYIMSMIMVTVIRQQNTKISSSCTTTRCQFPIFEIFQRARYQIDAVSP